MDWENELLAMLKRKAVTAKYELIDERWQIVKEEIQKIADYFLENDPDAEIEFQILPEFGEHCGLIIRVIDVFVPDLTEFCNLIYKADNMAINVSKNGYVQFEFTFCDIAKCVY